MKRKKIHLGRCKTKAELKSTSDRIIKRLIEKLSSGWNPWIDANNYLEYTLFTDICDKYRDYLYKCLKNDITREQTLKSYLSYISIFQQWVTLARITSI